MLEFSLDGYSQLLSALKRAGYVFCDYAKTDAHLAERCSFVTLRHDIDISLRPALAMAQIERQHGVQAIYFILLRSPFYNAFSRENAEIIEEIHSYGHQIATHVDLTFYNNDLSSSLVEIESFAQFYPAVNQELVSLHSPYPLKEMPVDTCQQLNNVYGAAVRGDVAYISDSTGRWRYGQPLESEAFKQRKPIQLLTHPIWWYQEGETPIQKLERWLYNDYHNQRDTLRKFLPKLFQLDEPSQ